MSSTSSGSLSTPSTGPLVTVAGFTFHVRAGTITQARHDGTQAIFATGVWSGHGPARNDPQSESLKGTGPLPRGIYTIGHLIQDGGHLGPFIMPLNRVLLGTGSTFDTTSGLGGPSFGRGGFYCHGASASHPENSSDGCIILPRDKRLALDKAYVIGDPLRSILVVA